MVGGARPKTSGRPANENAATRQSNPRVEGRLVLLLERDKANGTLVAGRDNKLNRKHYARLLGVTPSAMTYHLGIFQKYESGEILETNVVRHLPALREVISRKYENRELSIRDGKLSRRECFAELGLPDISIGAFPEIQALFEEFDARAASEGYLSTEMAMEQVGLCDYLLGSPVLTKSLDKISRLHAAEALKIPIGRLRSEHLAITISAYEAWLKSSLMSSKLVIEAHDRNWHFSELTAQWSVSFAQKVAARFLIWVNGKADDSAYGPYSALLAFLRWVPNQEATCCATVLEEARKHGRVQSESEWNEVLALYRQYFISRVGSGSLEKGSAKTAISVFRASLGILELGGVIPKITEKLRGVKNARRLSRGRPTLIEAAPAGTVEDYAEFTTRFLQEACKTYAVELDESDVSELVTMILQRGADTPSQNTNVKDAIFALLESMFADLREHARRILDEAMLDIELGDKLLSASTIDCDRFIESYFSASDAQRSIILRKFFPAPDGVNDDLAVANLLRLLIEKNQGFCSTVRRDDLGQFIKKRIAEVGGAGRITRLLAPDPATIAAVLTLYLLESGSNLAVGRTLNVDACEKADVTGYQLVTGHKARAKGKPIIRYLDAEGDAVRGMKWLDTAAKLSRSVAGVDSDRLFVVRKGDRAGIMNADRYLFWFKELVNSIPSLKHLYIVPSMIRGSVLLHAALANDGRLLMGMAIGQHTEGVSQGYQQRWPIRMVYDKQIAEFQKAFETLAIRNIPEAAAMLGILADEFQTRLTNLAATGLGVFCRDGTGRPGSNTTSCETVDCWNACPNMVVVAEVEAVAALQLWQASLREAEGEWVRDHPEKWERVWLPWLCFVDVVEEKIKRRFADVWEAAKKLVEQMRSQPGFVFVRPW